MRKSMPMWIYIHEHSSFIICRPECWARTRSDHLAFSLLTTNSNIQDAISSTKCKCVVAHVPKKTPASSDQSLPHKKVVNSRDVTNSQSDWKQFFLRNLVQNIPEPMSQAWIESCSEPFRNLLEPPASHPNHTWNLPWKQSAAEPWTCQISEVRLKPSK